MNNKSSNERLLELVKRMAAPRYQETLTPASLLLEEKILDSFGLIQLVGEIEREFSISIQNEDLTSQSFATITDITALVGRYITKG